jgi:hypothetical protein
MERGYPGVCSWIVLHIEISVGPQQLLKFVCRAQLSANAGIFMLLAEWKKG